MVQVHDASSLDEAKRQLKSQRFSLCLVDMRLPNGHGLDLLHYMRQQNLDLPAAMITAYADIKSAVSRLKVGAIDFLIKPVEAATLEQLVADVERMALRLVNDCQMRHILLGESVVMRDLRGVIHKVARSNASILIQGESGTGKELTARLIPLLVEHILRRLEPLTAFKEHLHLARAAGEALSAYAFPGNIRELENVLERAVALSECAELGLESLLLPEYPGQMEPDRVHHVASRLDEHIDDVERKRIIEALTVTGYNKTAASPDSRYQSAGVALPGQKTRYRMNNG